MRQTHIIRLFYCFCFLWGTGSFPCFFMCISLWCIPNPIPSFPGIWEWSPICHFNETSHFFWTQMDFILVLVCCHRTQQTGWLKQKSYVFPTVLKRMSQQRCSLWLAYDHLFYVSQHGIVREENRKTRKSKGNIQIDDTFNKMTSGDGVFGR